MLFFAFVIEPGFNSAIYRAPPADSGSDITFADTNLDLSRVNQLVFLFKGCNDCVMAFTDGPHTNGNGYEIVNGGWANTYSILRYVYMWRVADKYKNRYFGIYHLKLY